MDPAKDPPRDDGTPHTGAVILAAAIAVAAGYADAVAFLQLGGVFVSFMSGNTTELASLPAVGEMRKALLCGGVVFLYVMGAFAARLVIKPKDPTRLSFLLMVSAALLALSAVTWPVHHPASKGVAVAAVVLSMSVLSSARSHAGPLDLTSTFVTGGLVNLGHELADLVSGERSAWAAHLLIWLGLVLGAALGALGDIRIGPGSLIADAALVALLALSSGGLVRRRSAGDPS